MAQTNLLTLAVPERIDRSDWKASTGANIEKNFDSIFQWTQQVLSAIEALPSPGTPVTYPLAVTLGGTGLSSVGIGALLYGSALNTYSPLNFVATATRYLANTGSAATVPAWDQVDLTNGVKNVLPEGNGGTHQNTYATGDLLYASATATLSRLAFVATPARYLANSGSSFTVPQWDQVDLSQGVQNALSSLSELPSIASGMVLARTAAGSGVITAHIPSDVLDIIGSTQGDILYRDVSGWKVLAPSSGALVSGGPGTNPVWQTIPTGSGNLLSGVGNPETVVAAALGSQYQDTASGYTYTKVGGASTAYGWYRDSIVPHGGGRWVEWNPTDANTTFQVTNVDATGLTIAAAGSGNTTTATANSDMRYQVGTTGSTAGGAVSFLNTRSWYNFLYDLDIIFYITVDPTALTTTRYWVGIGTNPGNVDTITGAAKFLMFRLSSVAGDTAWQAISYDGATQNNAGPVGGAAAAGSTYKLRIRLDRTNNKAWWSVNDGTAVGSTTNIPSNASSAQTFAAVCINTGATSRSFGLGRVAGWYGK